MKVLLLSKYGRMGSSSRIRYYQYLPYLKSFGLEVTTAPLLSDGYLYDFYSGRKTKLVSIMKAYAKRLGWLLRSHRYELIWIECEVLPYLPGWAEIFLCAGGIPYVAEYDDAVFHRYDLHRSKVVRFLLGKNIDGIMRRSTLVIAGNEYLAARARNAGAEDVAILPSVVDLDHYPVTSQRQGKPFTIGWIGSPTTARFLELALPAINEVAKDRKVRVVLVGSGKVLTRGLPVEIREWSEETEVKDIKDFDVGIMPLPDDPWSRGKCGYKLVQYMACAIPVVASPVSVNKEIVQNGRNGFLAENKENWVQALNVLYENQSQSEEMGKAGRRLVEEKFCLQVTAPRLLSLLTSAAGHPSHP
jgi:glycosyltransferase involved in cell wall biosynthesis